MTIAVQIIAILFMVTLMFIGIWTFVIANKAYKQVKYKNYLLEKIANRLAIITEAVHNGENTVEKLNEKLFEEKAAKKDIEDILVKENKLNETTSSENLEENIVDNADVEEIEDIPNDSNNISKIEANNEK